MVDGNRRVGLALRPAVRECAADSTAEVDVQFRGWRMSMSLRLTCAAMVAALCLGCGGSAVDPTISVAVEPQVPMPFHGPNGPGSDTMSMSLRWAVVVTAGAGSAAVVRSIHTVIRDEKSGVSVSADEAPGSAVSEGHPLRAEQLGSCYFPSTAYPGRWLGVTTVEITHESGKVERLDASFAFN